METLLDSVFLFEYNLVWHLHFILHCSKYSFILFFSCLLQKKNNQKQPCVFVETSITKLNLWAVPIIKGILY